MYPSIVRRSSLIGKPDSFAFTLRDSLWLWTLFCPGFGLRRSYVSATCRDFFFCVSSVSRCRFRPRRTSPSTTGSKSFRMRCSRPGSISFMAGLVDVLLESIPASDGFWFEPHRLVRNHILQGNVGKMMSNSTILVLAHHPT